MAQGNCPECRSTDLDYDTVELDGGSAIFPFVCNKRGFVGTENYNLEFVGFTDEDGNEVDDE
jgi:hypothetical protein